MTVIQNGLSKIDSDIELCCCSQFIAKENLYRVQRWSINFGCFVDVTDADEEVKDGDRLHITNDSYTGNDKDENIKVIDEGSRGTAPG